MVHSQLPVPSLLCLFDALLMLSLEVLTRLPNGIYDVKFTSPGVQKSLAFALEKHNQDRDDTNYFKQWRLLTAQVEVAGEKHEYHLKVELVKTACIKEAGKIRKYTQIQECQLLPGDLEKVNCFFKVTPRSPLHEINLAIAACT